MRTKTRRPKPPPECYVPYGASWQLFHDQSPEILLSGPAGTGKSRACLEKLHFILNEVPGVRALMVRKTRESLTESALVTFEEKVLPRSHAVLAAGGQRRVRQSYSYPNGSVLVVGGLDKPGKIMSTEYDLIYVQEAIELDEDSWEALTTRLRNGVLSYQQLLADTNPDRPMHWLKVRCDTRRCWLLESRHEDNPVLWNAPAGDWTQAGRVYLTKLDALTGPRKQRLRYGRWVQAEGVVYDSWDHARHVVASWDAASAKRFVAGVDWGFTNAGVILVGAVDGDGRLTIVEEVYQSRQTIDWWVDKAKALKAKYRVERFACDPSEPAYIEQFRRAALNAVEALNDVMPGIGAVTERLQDTGDGRPRLTYLRSALHARDRALDEVKKPASMAEEIDGYVWNTTGGRKKGEEPVKQDDHGMDALRYLVTELDLRPMRKLNLWM